MTRNKINGNAFPNNKTVCKLDKQVFGWINSKRGEEAIKADIENKLSIFEEDSLGNFEIEKSYSRIKSKISAGQADNKPRVAGRIRRLGRLVAAVVVLLVVGVGGWLYYVNYLPGTGRNEITRYASDVKLILPDGSEILLDRSTENSRIAQHDNVVLTRENGVLVYEKQLAETPVADKLQWGAVVVPCGSRFDLVLEDGTKVWLNADSRLRFPVTFPDGERQVFLEGEAYFAVTGNKEKPFIVTTPAQSIKVLGTEFNVCAYHNSTAEQTTLIRGSVSLSAANSPESIILLPEQQATLSNNTGKYTVQQINARDAAAWRDGLFAFEGNSLEEVFFKLSKWYDIEYSFKDTELAELTFSGNLRQVDDVAKIFEIIETIGSIEIKITGRSVMIRRK